MLAAGELLHQRKSLRRCALRNLEIQTSRSGNNMVKDQVAEYGTIQPQLFDDYLEKCSLKVIDHAFASWTRTIVLYTWEVASVCCGTS